MNNTKVILGKVLSNKMQKTVVVGVEHRFREQRYGKVITKLTKLYAHCENPEIKQGDVVALVPFRPVSKLKRWRVLKVVSTGPGAAQFSVEGNNER